MPDCSRKKPGPADPNETAFSILKRLTAGRATESPEREKNPAAVALGKLGGAKGGKARAEALSPARRKAIAKKAARKRWANG